MAKIKDIKFDINGTSHCIHINCNSDGWFSANIPHFISEPLGIQRKLSFNTISALEQELKQAIHRYKTAQTSQEVYIGIRYGAAGSFNEKVNGDSLFFDKYGIRLSMESEESSALLFDYDVYIKETVDSVVKWYKAELGKDKHVWSGDPVPEPDKYYKSGSDLWDSKLKLLKMIPFSETALVTLGNAKEKIRAASEMLYNFISQDEEQIALILNTQKLLN